MKTYTGEYNDARISMTSTREETTITVVLSGASGRYDSEVLLDTIGEQITRLGYTED